MTFEFSLFFVALVVGYVLVHLRLVRFEEHLQKLAGIRSLDDRLRALDDRLAKLAESFDKIHLGRIEAHLERLHDDLEDVREATGEVQHAVVQIPPPPPAPAPREPIAVEPQPGETPAQRFLALVETRLLELGYHDIDVLSDLTRFDLAQEAEVVVEAWRGGMPVKGRVTVRNGSVRDVALQSVVTMFP
ncbi:MAG: hypothetical protein JNK15_02870 [Planctomycetes bacterium]|nr:hypothetical protein [Planctomycetota bacterium]